MMMPRLICLASLLVLVTEGGVFGAVPVEEPELGLRLNLPDGFVRMPEQENPNDFVRVYRQAAPGEPLATIVAVERLHGVLPRVDIKKARSNPQVSLSTERWQTFDIVVGQVNEVLNGIPAITLNAQVPLKPEAVQLKMIGPASQEPRLRTLLRDTLGTLHGSSNWLTAEERTQRLSEGLRRLGITIAVVALLAAVVVGAVWRVWRESRKRRI